MSITIVPERVVPFTGDGLLGQPVTITGEEARRILVVKYEDWSRSWHDPEFHVIHVPVTPGDPSRGGRETAMYAALPVVGADTLMPATHPVHTAKVGDRYQYKCEEGYMSPLYEYVGRFTLLQRFRDRDDQQWNVIQEVK